MEEQRTALNDPIRRRQLAVQIVHTLNLKLKTRNLDSTDEWKCLCPFHTEKTPQGSMYISPEKFVYHCFSCQAQGSLSSMYYRLTGRSFYKDFDIVNDEFTSFSFDTSLYAEPDLNELPEGRIETVTGVISDIEKSPEAVRYLRSRGIPFEIAHAMKMGFTKHAVLNGTTFRNRLTIPISERGVLLSVEGRDVTGEQQPKVLYPKNSTVRTLYDLDVLDRSKPLYVLEGLTKLAVLRADSYFANSTATFGAGLSDRQIYLLRQFDRVVMIPDADEAGKRSVAKMKDQLGKPFQVLEIPQLGGIKDVGDIPQKLHTTVEALRKRGWGRCLKSSLSLVFY